MKRSAALARREQQQQLGGGGGAAPPPAPGALEPVLGGVMVTEIVSRGCPHRSEARSRETEGPDATQQAKG